MTKKETILNEHGALIYLNIRGWGGTETKRTTNPQIKELISLLPDEYFDDLNSIRGQTTTKLARLSFDFPIRGTRFIPMPLVPEAEKIIAEQEAKYQEAVNTLLVHYEEAKAKAREALGPQYNEGSYPTAQAVRDKFGFRYTVFTVEPGIPFTGAIQVDTLLQDFKRDAYASLVSEFQKLISTMVTRLREGKKFHKSSFEGFNTFLENFKGMATLFQGTEFVNSVATVQAMVDQARGVFQGVVPEDVKGDARATLRNEISNALDSVKVEVEKHIENAAAQFGIRRLMLDDE